MNLPLSVVDGFRWPNVGHPLEIDRLERIVTRAKTMFDDSPPMICETPGQRPYVVHSGYVAVWLPAFRINGFRMFKIGIRPSMRDALREANRACGYRDEEKPGGPYLIDLDKQICTCEHYRHAAYCKHLIGLAHMLTRPHRVAESGLIKCDPKGHTLQNKVEEQTV